MIKNTGMVNAGFNRYLIEGFKSGIPPTEATLMKKNVAENRDYEPCSYCHAASAGRYVFVTEDGEKYHSSPNCSRLLRTVRRVKLSEVGALPECHKCR